MRHAEINKVLNICPPVAIVDNASIVSAPIDTAGWNHCQIILQLGAMDIAVTLLKVQESAASNMASASDVNGTVVGTDLDAEGAASSLPGATFDTTTTGIVIIDIPLPVGRKRYLDLVVTMGDGSAGNFASAVALLSRPGEAPLTAAQRGAAIWMRAEPEAA